MFSSDPSLIIAEVTSSDQDLFDILFQEVSLPTSTVISKDPYEISDKIIVPLDSGENLCMFFGLFNALRSTDLRVAFAGCRNCDSAYNFKKIIWEMDETFKDIKMKEGYNDMDMLHYLTWLKLHGHIKNFAWVDNTNLYHFDKKKLTKWIKSQKFNTKEEEDEKVQDYKFKLKTEKKRWKLTSLLARDAGHCEPLIYLLAGDARSTQHAYSTSEKKTFRKKMQKLSHASDQEVEIAKCKEYSRFSKAYKGPKWAHGVAVAMDEENNCFLYDSGKKTRAKLDYMALSNSIVHVHHVKKFKIDL